MFKKAQVVMLTTNQPSKLGNLVTYQKHNLAKVFKEDVDASGTLTEFWNLYIVSDEEIKEGDWYLANDAIRVTDTPIYIVRHCDQYLHIKHYYNSIIL